MDIKNQLMQKKSTLLKQITDAAHRGASQEILIAGEKLSRIESCIERYEKLVKDVLGLDTENVNSEPKQKIRETAKSMDFPDAVSGRGHGRTIRIEFLKKLLARGVHLEQVKGSIYKSHSGHKVGIAVATERKPDRWFLGLPLRSFDDAVLLCKRENLDTVEICLPKSFFDEYGNKMSRSAGQMKFNIVRRGSGYSILVPGTDGINVSTFVGDYNQLK